MSWTGLWCQMLHYRSYRSAFTYSLFCFRWMKLTLNTALPGRRKGALRHILAARAGTPSPWPPLTQGTVPKTGTRPHPIMRRGEFKALAWRITGSHPLACLPHVPLLPPRLFLPPPWLPPSVCSRERRGIRRSPVCQFLLLWTAEDAAWPRRAGAWGRTLLKVWAIIFNCITLKCDCPFNWMSCVEIREQTSFIRGFLDIWNNKIMLLFSCN